MLSVRLPEGMAQRLEEVAERTGRSKSYCVRLAIGDWLDAHDGATAPPKARATRRQPRPAAGIRSRPARRRQP